MIVESLWIPLSGLSLLTLGFVSCCCGGSQQQQQQILKDDDDEPKRICPECGLENPREAEYCGDCGFSFKRDSEDNDN
ncbi:hypothetical protein HLRTI_000935 [Halorhabdus tiamatea SARL4B]|uniref:Zinc-ribbon domain-containing protein n=1 Tax=Halorhabdus tiamatea SARL4B TaxID=1033806 RepID=U2DN08_9EURY|nr:hypothetical protein [Halorhabdus tiamatea]ERJ07077.1 hypothetical protein HLRTI_000935 [Halorhabdus tiamatea SARL4B]